MYKAQAEGAGAPQQEPAQAQPQGNGEDTVQDVEFEEVK